MSSLEDIFRSDFMGALDRDQHLAGICAREGASRIVASAADLVAREDPSWPGATLFLRLSDHVPELVAEVTASAALHTAMRKLLIGRSTRTRLQALGALGDLPEELGDRLRAEATAVYHRERDLVLLARVPDLHPELIEDGDWLVRWVAVPAHPRDVGVIERMSTDVHPLVAAEAKQRLANLAADEAMTKAAAAEGQGWIFYTPTDDRAGALFFGDVAKAFVASWPAEKETYTREELRAFVLAQAARS